MKVLLSGSLRSGGLTESLCRAFRHHGVAVSAFDDEASLKSKGALVNNRFGYRLTWRWYSKYAQEAFEEKVVTEKPDLVFILKGFFYSDPFVVKLRAMVPNTTFLYFNPDNPFNTWHYGNTNTWMLRSIPYYDIHLTWGKSLVTKLYAQGAKLVYHWPFACDPALHYPVDISGDEKEFWGADISFVGSWDEEREAWFSGLGASLGEYNLKIWGNSWEKASYTVRKHWQAKAAVGEDFSKVCAASKISLNFLRKQNAGSHNMRTFEIPACGGFMLATDSEEHRELFEVGKEIDVFTARDDLLNKINDYLVMDSLRLRMAQNAFHKTTAHTYNERVAKLLRIVNDFRRRARDTAFNLCL